MKIRVNLTCAHGLWSQSFIRHKSGGWCDFQIFFPLPSLCFPFLSFYFLVDKLTSHFRKQQCTCRGKNCYEIRRYINSHAPDSFHNLDRKDSKGKRYSIIPQPLFNYSNFKIFIIHFPLFLFRNLNQMKIIYSQRFKPYSLRGDWHF